MIKLEMCYYKIILTETQQKYQHYHQEKLINNNVLQVKKILTPDQRRVIEQAKMAYTPLGKAFEKRTKTIEEHRKKKQIDLLQIKIKCYRL